MLEVEGLGHSMCLFFFLSMCLFKVWITIAELPSSKMTVILSHISCMKTLFSSKQGHLDLLG